MKIKSLLNIKIYSYFILLVASFQVQKKVFKFDRYDVCEIGPSQPFNVSYFVIKPAGYGSVVDGSYEIFRTVKQIKIAAKITKCARKELLDSCEYVTTLKIPNACRYLAENKTLMSPMIYSHHPPLTCPIRKGNMVLIHGSFDPSLMSFFPLENVYWKMQVLAFEIGTDDFLFKLCIEGQVVVYRE